MNLESLSVMVETFISQICHSAHTLTSFDRLVNLSSFRNSVIGSDIAYFTAALLITYTYRAFVCRIFKVQAASQRLTLTALIIKLRAT